MKSYGVYRLVFTQSRKGFLGNVGAEVVQIERELRILPVVQIASNNCKMMLKIMTLLPDLRGGSGQQLMSLPLHLHLLLYQGELIGKLTVAASQNKGVSYKISAQCAHDKKKEQHADLEEKGLLNLQMEQIIITHLQKGKQGDDGNRQEKFAGQGVLIPDDFPDNAACEQTEGKGRQDMEQIHAFREGNDSGKLQQHGQAKNQLHGKAHVMKGM